MQYHSNTTELTFVKVVMNNCTASVTPQDCALTNITVEPQALLQGPVYLTFNIMLLVVSLASMIVNGLAIITLVMKSAISTPLRILLTNLLTSEVLGTLAGMFTVLTTLILLNMNTVTPSLIACRVNVWLFAFSSAGRICSLVAYSVAVYIVVKHGKTSFRVTHAIAAVIILWMLSFIITVDRLIPQTAGVRFLEGVRCVPFSNDGIAIFELRIALRLVWIIFGGLVPIAISITIPIAGLCYIKKALLGANNHIYVKAMMKLGLFLVAVKSFSFVGMLILTIIPFLSQIGEITSAVATYLLSITVTFTVLPTPILIFVTLKATRTNLIRLLKCCCSLRSDANKHTELVMHYRKVAD